jgi:hypothetical protein
MYYNQSASLSTVLGNRTRIMYHSAISISRIIVKNAKLPASIYSHARIMFYSAINGSKFLNIILIYELCTYWYTNRGLNYN